MNVWPAVVDNVKQQRDSANEDGDLLSLLYQGTALGCNNQSSGEKSGSGGYLADIPINYCVGFEGPVASGVFLDGELGNDDGTGDLLGALNVQTKTVATDPRRIAQREKQVGFGKSTIGYLRYCELVPRHERKHSDPQTPRTNVENSNRAFAGEITAWRRQLHEYDQGDDQGDDVNNKIDNKDDWLTHLRDWAVLPDKCAVVQKSLMRATAAEIDCCFNALLPHLVTFARDRLGNHTLQCLLKKCTPEQLAQALPMLFQVETIVELTCDQFSNHVLQQYLQLAPTDLLIQAVKVVYANPDSLLKMACDRIGNYVIQCCVKVSPANLDDLTSVFAAKDILPQISQHQVGNHVLRCVIENNMTDNLRASLWNHWDTLSFDKYGNLCIQKFISKITAEDLEIHAHELPQRGTLGVYDCLMTQLATHHFANHVLQSYVDQAVYHNNAQTVVIIVEAMKKDFFELATDQFGSFVVCTALTAFGDASSPLVDVCVQGSNIYKIASTQYGCQLLQKWTNVASEIQFKRISIALSSCFAAVSRDKFGNHFCLKMLSSRAASVLNRQEGMKGLSQLIMNVATLAEHECATHVVQRILELQVWLQLSDDTRTNIAAAIGKNLPRLARHKLGLHVARKAFSVVFGGSDGSSEKKSASKLLRALGSCFLQVAMDQHGCRLFQVCIGCGHDDLTELLVSQCCANINRLSRHMFGSVSVRALLNGYKGLPGVRDASIQRICDALAPHSASLARDRHGNLVLQAAIRATKTPESLKAAGSQQQAMGGGSQPSSHHPAQHAQQYPQQQYPQQQYPQQQYYGYQDRGGGGGGGGGVYNGGYNNRYNGGYNGYQDRGGYDGGCGGGGGGGGGYQGGSSSSYGGSDRYSSGGNDQYSNQQQQQQQSSSGGGGAVDQGQHHILARDLLSPNYEEIQALGQVAQERQRHMLTKQVAVVEGKRAGSPRVSWFDQFLVITKTEKFREIFEGEECTDQTTLQLFTEMDFKNLGLSMGARRRVAAFLQKSAKSPDKTDGNGNTYP